MSTGGFDIAFQHELARNTWIMYSIGMVLVSLRFYTQIRRGGIAGFMKDDYIVILAALLYTMLMISLNVIVVGGGSNLFLPGEDASFTPKDIKDRIFGSKIVLVSEQAMLNVIYSLKACVLIMYGRLTSGTTFKKFVKYLSIYVAIGWFATEVAFFTACTPFKGYWAVPPPNPQCTTLQHYAIIQATFNISSDLMMLLIVIPMFISLRLPIKQKIILCGVFSMGIFVITAAILTKVFNLSDVYNVDYMLWYTRESSVAMYVANLPLIWPLLREFVPYFGSSTKNNSYALPTHESRKGGANNTASGSQGYSKHMDSQTTESFNEMITDSKSNTARSSQTPETVSIETIREKGASDNVSSPTSSSFITIEPMPEKVPPPNFSTLTRASLLPSRKNSERVGTAISTTRPSNEFVKQVERVKEEKKRHSGILTMQQKSSGWGQHGKIKTETTIEVSSNASQVERLGNDDFSAGAPMGYDIEQALAGTGARSVKIQGPQISHW